MPLILAINHYFFSKIPLIFITKYHLGSVGNVNSLLANQKPEKLSHDKLLFSTVKWRLLLAVIVEKKKKNSFFETFPMRCQHVGNQAMLCWFKNIARPQGNATLHDHRAMQHEYTSVQSSCGQPVLKKLLLSFS